MANKRHKVYNPFQRVKNFVVKRFRGLMVPDLKTIMPAEYVGDCRNLTSKIIRRLDVRDGQTKQTESYSSGILQGAVEPKYRAIAEGTRFWIKGRRDTFYKNVDVVPTPTSHVRPFNWLYSTSANNPIPTDSKCSDLWAVHTELSDLEITANANVNWWEEGINKCWRRSNEDADCEKLWEMFPGYNNRRNYAGKFPNCWNINSLPWMPSCSQAHAQRPDLKQYEVPDGDFPECWEVPDPTCTEVFTLNAHMSEFEKADGVFPDCYNYPDEEPEEVEEVYEYPFTDCEQSFTASISPSSLSWNLETGYGTETDTVTISLAGVFDNVKSIIQNQSGQWIEQEENKSVRVSNELSVSFGDDTKSGSPCSYTGTKVFTPSVTSSLATGTHTGTFKVAVARRLEGSSVLKSLAESIDPDSLNIFTVSYTIDVWDEMVVGASYSSAYTKDVGESAYAYGSGTPTCENLVANYNWSTTYEPSNVDLSYGSSMQVSKRRQRGGNQYVAKVIKRDYSTVITIVPPAGEWTEARLSASVNYTYRNNGYTERVGVSCPLLQGYLSVEAEDEGDIITTTGTALISGSVNTNVTATISLDTLGLGSVIPFTGAGVTPPSASSLTWKDSYINVNTLAITLYLRT